MIDFRYHLISIIAVILALSLGIVVGSGFLGGPLLERLERQVKELETANKERQVEIGRLDAHVEESEQFARSAGEYLTRGVLDGEEIVLFQFDATNGNLIDGFKRAATDAGGRIVTEITIGSKFSLTSQPTRDELSLILGGIEGEPDELRTATGASLGERSADAATAQQNDAPSGSEQRLESLLQALERAEFIGAVTEGDRPPVPQGSLFVVIGGSESEPAFDPTGMGVALVEALAERGAATMLIESGTSTWALVASVRDDVEARSLASTVDNGETSVGRIATILGLRDAQAGAIGHFGFAPGRTAVIPAPRTNP